MLVTLEGIEMEIRLSQQEKAPSPILVTPEGIEKFNTSKNRPTNTPFFLSIRTPSLYAKLGEFISSCPCQPANGFPVIVFTQEGIEMNDRLEQPENAPEPILVTLEGMKKEARREQPLNASSPMVVTIEGIEMEVNPEQALNTPLPILVTLEGTETESKAEQFSNAPSPILVTQEGTEMESKP